MARSAALERGSVFYCLRLITAGCILLVPLSACSNRVAFNESSTLAKDATEVKLIEVVGSTSIDAGLFFREPKVLAYDLATVKLRNVSDSAITLFIDRLSCGCSNVTFDPQKVQPGDVGLAHISMRPGEAGLKRLNVDIGAKTNEGLRSKISVQLSVTLAGLQIGTERFIFDLPYLNNSKVASVEFDYALFKPEKDTSFSLLVPKHLGPHDLHLELLSSFVRSFEGHWMVKGRARLEITSKEDTVTKSGNYVIPITADVGGRMIEKQVHVLLRNPVFVDVSPQSLVLKVPTQGLSPTSNYAVALCRERKKGMFTRTPRTTSESDDIIVSSERKERDVIEMKFRYTGIGLKQPAKRRVKIEFGSATNESVIVTLLLLPTP